MNGRQLPEAFDVVLIENRIGAENRNVQVLGLSYQQTIKRVTMMQR